MRIITLSIAISSLIIVSACTPGGGYTRNNQWDYGSKPIQTTPSQSAPVNETPPSGINAPAPAQSIASSANLQTVKVALLAPLSGKHQRLGQSMLNAAQIALFDTGHSNYQLIPKDTKGNASGARKAAEEAVKDGAQLILGPVFAESVRAAKPIAASSRINMLAFSTDWTLAGDNVFIMGFLPFDQVERLTKYVATSNIKNVGVIAANDNYGAAVTSAYNRLAPRYGINTITQKSFNPRSRNLSADIRALTNYDTRSDGAPAPFDAVLMPVGGNQASTISNLMTQFGAPPNTVRRLGTGLMDDSSLASEPGLSGAWFAAPSPNLRKTFEQKYTSTYARTPPRLATLAYDATALSAILAQRGLQNGGRPQFDRRSLTNPNGFFGIDGIFRFRPDGTVERGLAILEFRNGRIIIKDEAPKTFEQTQF